ncbi:hypothetical protein [Streptomyces sp. NPDC048106]|uniref:hypothetical protein n=1 Tax=Streptomyces sp. NPDC048106 TaxID=3155750 RepID=UPI003455847F
MSAPPDAAHTEAPPTTPDGYQLSTWNRPGVAHTLIRTADGAFAARGQAAVSCVSGGADVENILSVAIGACLGLSLP